jgi:aerobic carbon-monoxide dehydrogenase medium subunit
MGLRSFEYIEPLSTHEACLCLRDLPEEARIYAGGTSLLLLMKQGIIQPTHLVNLKKITALRYIQEEPSSVLIGALTTHHELEVSPVIKQHFPVISDTELQIANIRVRSTGTVGGNLAFAEPLTDLPPIFIALGAQVRIEGPNGQRSIPLERLFSGYYETTLDSHELLVEVELPKQSSFMGIQYIRFSSGSDKPAVGCAIAVKLDASNGTCTDARVVLGCVAPTPLRVPESETLLIGSPFRPELAARAALLASRSCSPLSDLRGSESYKRSIVQVLVKRAVPEAFHRAKATAVAQGE